MDGVYRQLEPISLKDCAIRRGTATARGQTQTRARSSHPFDIFILFQVNLRGPEVIYTPRGVRRVRNQAPGSRAITTRSECSQQQARPFNKIYSALHGGRAAVRRSRTRAISRFIAPCHCGTAFLPVCPSARRRTATDSGNVSLFYGQSHALGSRSLDQRDAGTASRRRGLVDYANKFSFQTLGLLLGRLLLVLFCSLSLSLCSLPRYGSEGTLENHSFLTACKAPIKMMISPFFFLFFVHGHRTCADCLKTETPEK